MRLLFLISDAGWTPHARVFVAAARGLAAAGHETLVACESECPVQAHAAAAAIEVLSLDARASGAGDALQLRRALRDRQVDAVFVHTDAEHLVASSAARLGAGAAAVVRRIPPFANLEPSRAGRFAARVTASARLFSTEADRASAAAADERTPSGVAPLGVDLHESDAVQPVSRDAFGVPPDATLVVCVHGDGDHARAIAVLRAFALLAPRHRELHLALVGAGAMDDLRMHGAALGINSFVSYLGERDDDVSILRAANVAWIGADGDAAALAILDSMAFGIPVIAPRTPLTEHYVADGVTGILLAATDAPGAAATAADFLAMPQRDTMGTAARARLERHFPFDAMIRGFEAMAESVSHRPTARTG